MQNEVDFWLPDFQYAFFAMCWNLGGNVVSVNGFTEQRIALSIIWQISFPIMFDNKYPYLEIEKSIWLVKENKKFR